MKNLLFVFLLLPIFANGQKIEKDETDPFTKKRIRETSFEKLVSKGRSNLDVKAVALDSNIFLAFALFQPKYTFVTMGDSLLLLLDDDNVLPLYIVENKMSREYTKDQKVLDFLVNKLSNVQSEILLRQGIKAIRIYQSGIPISSMEVPEKFRYSIKNVVKLMM